MNQYKFDGIFINEVMDFMDKEGTLCNCSREDKDITNLLNSEEKSVLDQNKSKEDICLTYYDK